MDEHKYKESIDEYIGDEKLFNQQLKGRILNEIRSNKQRKGMTSFFKKAIPVVITLLLVIGSGTFLYLTIADKQRVSSPDEDPATLAEQAEEENFFTMSQLSKDFIFNDQTVLNVNVLDDKGKVKQNVMIENEQQKKEILNEFLNLRVRKLDNAYLLTDADYQVVMTTEKEEFSMFVMKKENRIYFSLPQQEKESYYEVLKGDKFFVALDNAIQSAALPNKEEVPSDILFNNGDGKTFSVPITSIPDFNKYLAETSDKIIELERILVDYLDWNRSNDQYFVLKYGCGNKTCQLELVQISDQNEVKTKNLGEGSLTGSELFEEKAMLRIAVNEGIGVIRHQIVIIDLNTMQMQHPINKKDDELYFNSSIYPITHFKWMNENTIELHVADIPDTTYESIEKWYNSKNLPEKNVLIAIE